jgi:hypothetical protein
LVVEAQTTLLGSSDKIENKTDQGNNENQMDETASDMEGQEPKPPKQQQ